MPRKLKSSGAGFDDSLAGEYVLGLGDASSRADADAMRDASPGYEQSVAEWTERLAPLAAAVDEVAPAPGLWNRIQERLAAPEIALPGTRTVRGGEGEWQALGPGAAIKTLSEDHRQGTRSFLLRLEAGAELPGHDHTVDEECYVLAGDMVIGGVRFNAGDYHWAPRGVPHGAISSLRGGLILVRGGIAAQLHS